MNGNGNGNGNGGPTTQSSSSSSLYHDGTGIGGWIDGVLGSSHHHHQSQGQYASQQQMMYSGGWPPAAAAGGGGGGAKNGGGGGTGTGPGLVVGDHRMGVGLGNNNDSSSSSYADYSTMMMMQQQQQQQQQSAAGLDRSLSPSSAAAAAYHHHHQATMGMQSDQQAAAIAFAHQQQQQPHYAQHQPQQQQGGYAGAGAGASYAPLAQQHQMYLSSMNGSGGQQQQQQQLQDLSSMMSTPPPVAAAAAGPVASVAAATAAAATTIPSTGSAASIASMAAAGRQMIGGLLDDEVIPTAIVIKNIPFAVQKETLLAIIESLQAPLPYAFNYHHDNGVFRGLAFANFRHPHEADAVVVALNGYDISGRKLRVEYKKVLQAGEKERIEREKAIKRMRSMQFDKGLQQQHMAAASAAPPPPMPTMTAAVSQQQQQPQQTNGSMGPPASTQPRQGRDVNGAQRGSTMNGGGSSDSPLPSPAAYSSQQHQQQPSWTDGGGRPSALTLDGQMRGLSIDHHSQKLLSPSPSSLNGTGHHGSGGAHAYAASGGGGGGNYLASDQESDRAPSVGGSSTKSGRVYDGSSSSEHSAPLPTTVDFNDPVALDIYSRVLLFKEDRMRDELAFSRSLSQRERRIVHLVAQKLALCHRSVGQAEERYVVVTRDQAHATSHYQRAMPSSRSAAAAPVASPYSPPPQEDTTSSVPSSPGGLRIKKSMPNLSNFNGQAVGREQRGLVPKRSSGNLRDYSTVSGNGTSAARRSFQAPGGVNGTTSAGSAGQTFKALFGAPLGNGSSLGNGTSFESMHSPTSPVDLQVMQQQGGAARQPRGPGSSELNGFETTTNASGRNSAASTRSQQGSSSNVRSNPVFAPAPVGSHRGSAAGSGFISSLSGSVTSASIEEEAATGSDQGSYSSGRSSGI